jgi:hypothetical protein
MHERGYACGMQIGKANKGCRICMCACIRSEPAVEFACTPVAIKKYFVLEEKTNKQQAYICACTFTCANYV